MTAGPVVSPRIRFASNAEAAPELTCSTPQAHSENRPAMPYPFGVGATGEPQSSGDASRPTRPSDAHVLR
jgi:hypothetical protein